ncbi:hypothetical protein [Azospirillum sp. sgz301742]
MLHPARPLRPGDVIRVGRSIPLQREDEESLDFLRVHYDTASPGLARVVETADDGMVLSLWGHRFRTTEPPTSPRLRALGPLAYRFAPERLGEAILAREVRRGRVVMEPPRHPWQPVVRTWLRRTRGHLPILEALGGRMRPPVLRRWKARLLRALAQAGVMPSASGFLDHGLLIDRIGRSVTLTYGWEEREVWLDRILLHKNHTLHLVGIDLAKREQRTFRLDRVQALEVPPVGEVDPHDLWLELQTLCMSRAGWLWYWNKRQAERGLALAPPIGLLGRTVSRASKALAALGRVWNSDRGAVRLALRRWWLDTRWTGCWRLRSVGARARALWWRIRPPPPKRVDPFSLSTVWRDRLLRTLATVEAGGTDQITALLPMNALLADPVACQAWLHHLLERTLDESADTGPGGHPLAQRLLAETLSLVPAVPVPPSERQRQAVHRLYADLVEAQPGRQRISVHATRRAGRDSRLLLCEAVLQAIHRIEDDAPDPWRGPGGEWPRPPKPWFFYRANAYFVARWDEGRFRVDASSAPRLRAVLAWWDARLRLTPPPAACRPPACG